MEISAGRTNPVNRRLTCPPEPKQRHGQEQRAEHRRRQPILRDEICRLVSALPLVRRASGVIRTLDPARKLGPEDAGCIGHEESVRNRHADELALRMRIKTSPCKTHGVGMSTYEEREAVLAEVEATCLDENDGEVLDEDV